MRELITEGLAKFEEKVLLLRTLETVLFRGECRGENRQKFETRVQATKEHIAILRQAIIDYASGPLSQTRYGNLEAAIDGEL